MDPTSPPLIVVPGIDDLVEVGRGGAGVVYRGHQGELGRDVAVKVVWSAGAGDADLARWRREVTAMGRLSNHPNIVAVHDGGTTADGLPYLVMPYVPGGSVGRRLQAEGPLPPGDVVAIGVKLAGALAAAHEAGVLHRDVKPDNVLLSQYGEPQLADFGIARLADSTMTATGTVHATVAYAAPEVLAGRTATETSDVYGLGATLHACLTGAPPFAARQGETLVALAVRIGTEPPPDLRAAGVPGPLAAVLADAMAKDPATRIPTAAELRRRLEEVASAHEAAPEPAPAPPMAHEPDRRRWQAAVLAGLVVAIVGVVVALAVLGDDGEPERSAAGTPSASASAPASTVAPPSSPPAATTASDLGAATTDYFDAIAADDFERAYAMTTAGFRDAQPFDGFVDFWGGFDAVAIDDGPSVDESELSAAVTLRLDDGTERYTLRFVRADDGTLLVDGPRPG